MFCISNEYRKVIFAASFLMNAAVYIKAINIIIENYDQVARGTRKNGVAKKNATNSRLIF